MNTIEIFIIIYLLILNIFVIRKYNETYVCPQTGIKDFKKNMYKYTWFHCCREPHSHSAWFTKEGYEKRFDCKIIKDRRKGQKYRIVYKGKKT